MPLNTNAGEKTEKSRGGRPLLQLDPQAVRLLASAFCTNEEIAAKLGCSPDTLTRRFADVLREGRDSAKASLRAMQFKSAMNGSDKMLIWLGKQYLGQRERVETGTPRDYREMSDEQLDAELAELERAEAAAAAREAASASESIAN